MKQFLFMLFVFSFGLFFVLGFFISLIISSLSAGHKAAKDFLKYIF